MAAYDDNYQSGYSTVDEQKKRAQAQADAAAQQSGYGGNVGSSVTNQVSNVEYPTAGLQTTAPIAETAAERLARQTQERLYGSPDNPQPYAAPEGTHWNNYNGTWYLYNAANVRIGDASGYDKTKVNVSSSNNGDTIISSVDNGDGTTTTTWKSGRKETNVTYNKGGASTNAATPTALKTDAQLAAEATAAANQAQRQSAYDLLYSQFKQYGLESLVAPLKGLVTSGSSPSEFTIKLRETPEYKKRFAANDMRIANGFAAIDEATYLALEDKYQSLMQNYGLPPQMYAKGDLGTQEGFQKLIAGNVDPITAEERILEGKKLTSSTKQTLDAAKQFYPSLTDGDILAYVLDPKNALSDIKRKVTAAEIGGAQMGAGLQATAAGAEALAGAGVTGSQYQQAAPFISEAAKRGSELASFYGQGTYDQTTAEAEALNLAGSAEAAAKRKKITSLATADFSGSSGVGALGREKAIYGATYGQSGLY
jgi:hypothetical protein